MVLSSNFSKALKLTFAVMIAVPLVTTALSAQDINRGSGLSKTDEATPWRKPIDKLYRPVNPQSELDRAKRVIFGDPAKKVGLPSHGIQRPKAPNTPSVEPVTLDPAVSHLDKDGDGSVSQNEYFQGRARLTSPGIRGNRSRQRRDQRLKSQFRRTDLDGDGKVTPDELNARGSGRF